MEGVVLPEPQVLQGEGVLPEAPLGAQEPLLAGEGNNSLGSDRSQGILPEADPLALEDPGAWEDTARKGSHPGVGMPHAGEVGNHQADPGAVARTLRGVEAEGSLPEGEVGSRLPLEVEDSLPQQEVVERLEGVLEVLPVGCKVDSPHQEQQAGSPGIAGTLRAVDIRRGHNTVTPEGAGPPGGAGEGGWDEGHQGVPRVDPNPEVQQHWAAQEVRLLRAACHCYQKMVDLKSSGYC